ncbi:MAG: DUF5110 domain-containing protein, partial [Sphingomonas sp.]
VADFPGGEKNPAWRELYARWLQFSAFNPIMRIHGTDVEREPYLFKTLDPDVYASLRGSVGLRYRLLPYIYGLSWQVTSAGYTMMRPLMMDFPDDRATDTIDDSFMFGPALLVHPVTRAMYNLLPPPAAAIPTEYLRTPDGQSGLALQYFEGENFETPKAKLVDQKIDHNWPDPPLAEIPGGLSSLRHFSARWQGEIIAPEDGEYEIGVAGNDGFRLFLAGEKATEDWAPGAERYRSVKRVLKKGERLPVRIDYYQIDGNRVLRLAWRRPSDLRSVTAAVNAPRDLTMHTYLPKGSGWYDFWTNQHFAGGETISREAPLDVVPLYVRAGSIVPMGPDLQYATERPDAPYEVRIYPGADARFTVYEDDNETYAYEKGQRATYDLVWNDKARTLTIGARRGAFPGMVKRRRLDFALMGAVPAKRQLVYAGKATSVTFGR